jgi:anti-sigma regulatory factor (Ser/Thr protein kinase)
MATVDVRFTALPAHVRTARLVALAVARRTGVSEELIDEVRLAVGEACSRAVGVNSRSGSDVPVGMRLCDDDRRFTVEVIDIGPLDDASSDANGADFGGLDGIPVASILSDEDSVSGVPAGFGLVVIGGLVEEVVVTSDDAGTHVTMSWPTGAQTS